MTQLKEMDVPEPFRKSCFVENNVFSEEECQNFILKMGEDPTKIDAEENGARRIVQRTSLQDAELAEELFNKIKTHSLCPDIFSVDKDNVIVTDGHMGPLSSGVWRLDSVSPRIQLYKYQEGGVFSKHRDGPTYYSGSHRSFFTVLVYLNDGYTGGATTVFTDDLSLSFSIPSSRGSCFAMLQRTLHEGSVVLSGLKYALRCDVLYKRVAEDRQAEKKIEEELVSGLEKKEQAKQWFKLASAIELSGKSLESVVYYQKAYKLDPNLEEVEL